MRIKLYKDAAAQYVRRCYKHASPQAYGLHNEEFYNMLKKVQDTWLEVEIDYLFSDQFNTAPIPGVSESGMRIMAESVEEIEGDIRPGRYIDRWTNKNYAEIPAECLTEERRKYLYQWIINPNPRAGKIVLEEISVYESNN
jgi:hypothetical protein